MNIRHNIGAENRARQRELQGELRRVLRGIDDELDQVSKSIDYGQDAPEVGPFTQDAFKSLQDLAKRLTRPDPDRVETAAHAVICSRSSRTLPAGTCPETITGTT